jgi:hypothetical protein
VTALRAKKHLYLQKPMATTPHECRVIAQEAAKTGVVTQLGNQGRSSIESRLTVELLRSGAIGKIKAVHSWQANRGNGFTGLTALPESRPVPASLDWDRWIGVAPMRPYAGDVYHPFKWRDWQDFGSGTLGDFGCHILDPVFTALELTAPITIRAENDGLNPQTWPGSETINYLFPGTTFTADKTFPLTWYDGGRKPDLALAQMPEQKQLPGSGSLFVGEGGALVLPHVAMPQLYPTEKFAAFEMHKEPGVSHYHAWIDGVLAGTKTTDGFDYAGPLTETVQLGNVATRTPGKALQWDAAHMRIANSPEGERLLTTKYREGWTIEAVG